MATGAETGRSRTGRPTQAEALQLTERLREAAADTFLEYGYDRTTMEAVARAAGITKRTLYARYPDKRRLFIAVIAWALARQERHQPVGQPVPDDLAGGLMAIARPTVAAAVAPDAVRLRRMAIAEAARFPEFATSAHSLTWLPRMREVMDLLGRHAAAGTVTIADVELAAEQFIAMVAVMPSLLATFGVFRSAEAEERHLRHAVDLFLNGVLAR